MGAASMVLFAACSSGAGTPTSAPSAAAPSTSAAASEAAPSASGSGASTGEAVRVAFVAGQIGITFYTGVECGAKAAAKEFNVDLNWTGSHNWDINETRPLIDAAKATNPQGWVISPTDPDALISDISHILVNFLETVNNMDRDVIDIVVAHKMSIKAVLASHLKGDGGKTGKELREALMEACGRFYRNNKK